jgi:hypothetical protein
MLVSMAATEDDASRSLCSRSQAAELRRSRRLVDDLDKDAVARARGAGANDSAQRARDSPLAADHLADVVLGDVQLQDERAVALDLVDADGVGIVDEPPRQLGEQFSQCSWPSAGA